MVCGKACSPKNGVVSEDPPLCSATPQADRVLVLKLFKRTYSSDGGVKCGLAAKTEQKAVVEGTDVERADIRLRTFASKWTKKWTEAGF